MKKIIFTLLLALFLIPSPVFATFESPLGVFTYDISNDDFVEFTLTSKPTEHFYIFVAKESSTDGGSAMACHFNFGNNTVGIWNGTSETNVTAISPGLGDLEVIGAYFDGTNAHCFRDGTDIINIPFTLPGTNNHYAQVYNNYGNTTFSSVSLAISVPSPTETPTPTSTPTPTPTPTSLPTPTPDPSLPTPTPSPVDETRFNFVTVDDIPLSYEIWRRSGMNQEDFEELYRTNDKGLHATSINNGLIETKISVDEYPKTFEINTSLDKNQQFITLYIGNNGKLGGCTFLNNNGKLVFPSDTTTLDDNVYSINSTNNSFQCKIYQDKEEFYLNGYKVHEQTTFSPSNRPETGDNFVKLGFGKYNGGVTVEDTELYITSLIYDANTQLWGGGTYYSKKACAKDDIVCIFLDQVERLKDWIAGFFRYDVTKDEINGFIENNPLIVDSSLISVVSKPIVLLNNLTTQSCQSIELPLPYINGIIYLPCMRNLLVENFPEIMTVFDIVSTGTIGYWFMVMYLQKTLHYLSPKETKVSISEI